MVKNLPASIGDVRVQGSIPGSGRSPGEGNGNPLWYSRLENPMDRGTWQATVHGVTKTWTQLSNKAQHSVLCVPHRRLDSSREMMDKKCTMHLGGVLDTHIHVHTHTHAHTHNHMQKFDHLGSWLLVGNSPGERSQTHWIF